MDSESYPLRCYRYIELNPVRAGMVAKPDDYRWSSFAHNAHGAVDRLIHPHASWLALGAYRSKGEGVRFIHCNQSRVVFLGVNR